MHAQFICSYFVFRKNSNNSNLSIYLFLLFLQGQVKNEAVFRSVIFKLVQVVEHLEGNKILGYFIIFYILLC